MTAATDDLGELELRLQRAFRAALPAAPPTLLDRLEGTPALPVAATRLQFGLLLIPIVLAGLLVALALNVGTHPRPTGAFEVRTVDAFDGAAMMYDVWALRSEFVGMIWGVPNSVERADLALSHDGRSWGLVAPPRDGFVVNAGAVVGDEVHVLGYTGAHDDPAWWHEAMDGSGKWREIGLVTGIPASTYVVKLIHGSAGWLAWLESSDSSSVTVPGVSGLRYSEDGLSWAEPNLPVQGAAMYHGLATDGNSLLALRTLEGEGATTTDAIVSDDGRDWSVHPVTSTIATPWVVAFGKDRFVGLGYEDDAKAAAESSGRRPAAWTSTDGSVWAPAAIDVPDGDTSDGLGIVAATEAGFVAVGDGGGVWVSRDGASWVPAGSLPRAGRSYAAAAAGDTLLVGGAEVDNKPAVWVASLSEVLR